MHPPSLNQNNVVFGTDFCISKGISGNEVKTTEGFDNIGHVRANRQSVPVLKINGNNTKFVSPKDYENDQMMIEAAAKMADEAVRNAGVTIEMLSTIDPTTPIFFVSIRAICRCL